MAEVPCPGTCNYRWREADAAYKLALNHYDPLDPKQSRPELPQIKPVYGSPWCPRCQGMIRRELAELDDLAAMLAAAADGQRGRRPGAKMPPKGKQHGGPSPSPTADLLSELYSVLCAWEQASLGQPRTRRGFLAAARSQVIDRLADQFDTVIITTRPEIEVSDRKVPFAVWFGEGVRHWHRRLVRLAKAGTGTHHKPVRCPRCERMMLFWVEGDDYVECRNSSCGRLIGLDEYNELADKQVRAHSEAPPRS